MKPDCRIFDTNVPIIANRDQSPQATVECQNVCIDQIKRLIEDNEFILAIDWGEHGSEILTEYRRYHRDAGTGVGDSFLQWVFQNYWDEEKCHQVEITKKGGSYAEFPSDPALAGFDPADHKWIATACSHRGQHGYAPDIVQAADMKWKDFEAPLRAHGITIDFICDTSTSKKAVKSTKPKKKQSKKSK